MLDFWSWAEQSITYMQNHPEQRVGQALMNALHFSRPELSRELPKRLDIWETVDGRDPLVLEFYAWTEENWHRFSA